MLNYPKSYEEAKIILEGSVKSDYFQKQKRLSGLKNLFLTGCAIGAAIGVGVVKNDALLGALTLPNLILLESPLLLPYFLRVSTERKILNGTYFKEHTEEEIMIAAEDYVNRYNKYEEKNKRGSR